ncbi:MAG: glutamate dehydrogenase [Micavibrio sp.]|nr:MAG: glutamate dehydrogenase [Micavibrio sp.]
MSDLINKALKQLPAKATADQKKFLKIISAEIPEEDMVLFDPALFAKMALTHYELAKKKGHKKPKLKIYCPAIKGQTKRKTIIDLVSDDLAFLIDSIAAEINKHNLLIHLLVHPIVYVQYDKSGRLKDISKTPQKDYKVQSHIHVQIHETLSQEELSALETGLYTAIDDVFTANQDWRAMLKQLKLSQEQLAAAKTKRAPKEIEKYCAFLDYLYNNNFTLLAFREYEFVERSGALQSKTVKGSSLGLLHDDIRPAYISESDEGLPRNLQELRRNLAPVSISKTNRLSTVHRRVPMDAIAVKTYNPDGSIKGEKLFLGLFTSVTYSRSVSDVPYLRQKVEDTIDASGFTQGSHDRKALRHILEKYPRDELFQIEVNELLKISLNILRLQERQRIALFMRRDPFGRYISCLVYVPRDRFGTKLRKSMVAILEEELGGTCTDFYTTMDDSVYARVMCIVNVNQKNPPKYSPAYIEKLLQETGQTWAEMLSDALVQTLDDEDTITRLTLKYDEAFPVAYTARFLAKHAVFDIDKIEQTLETGRIILHLYRSNKSAPNQLRMKVYHPGSPLTLSDVMPIMEDMGLRAISELPFEIKPGREDKSVWIHDFLLELPEDHGSVIIKDVKENFETAFTKIWYNEMESDGLNRLVLGASAGWQEVTILRAYVRYLRQIRYPFSRPYIEKALTEHPNISRAIVDLFTALHNPANGNKGEKLAVAVEKKINKALEDVESLDQDRILRNITAMVNATLRTNFFQSDKDGNPKSYLSLKLKSGDVPDLPEPKPFVEVFVYSPRVEAIHLRGDMIARGGLRWSDRHEDFRTEVLGLMKAQMVKNAVIVPMGAKGGFVVKSDIKDRDEFFKEGVECYKTLIRGLLDITDNRKGNKIVPPKKVMRRDGNDPYLVVAADKGTATFSDIANGLSQDYGFWLDDAFASGGSAGYDHKKMGITAKGGWESVKLHFRQLNHNTQTQPFDVVGVGDMGGDVFGNGMLLSKEIRLIGAFNHMHIFCDPNPDTAESFKERKRLFDKIKGWGEYDEKKLSKGGRIYSRTDKTLTLTPEIRKRFDIDKEKVTPNELMRAMLLSRTDLLWFGGIGTYIKAKSETDADAGDKTNDALRINGSELRAKVIGEGANLGVTQLGRIEFAENGGMINTDFLDNSGGVDSSDHEVNIKILMSDVMATPSRKMTVATRNKLLEQMTDEIAEHVLRNNYQQAQAISLAELQARENLQIQDEYIQEMERELGLNREIEGLPDTETIQQRLRNGKGMTRPELCVLLSYSKINFTQDLLDSDIPDNPDMQGWLMNYFPVPLREKYKKEIQGHRLKREIIATVMANSLVNRMGPTFLKSTRDKTGASPADIARAYIIVREAFGLRALWDEIEALDNEVPAEVQMKAMRDISDLAEHAINWFLTRLGRSLDISQDIKGFSKGIEALQKNLNALVTNDLKQSIEQRLQAQLRDGLPKTLAKKIALLPALSSACDIIRIALEQKTDVINTARAYFELGEKFHLSWLRQQARYLPADDHWSAEATSGLVDQLYGCQAGLTVRILKDANGRNGKDHSPVEKWLQKNGDQARQLDPLFAELRRAGTIDLAMLIIAEQRLRNLYDG